MKQKDQMAVLVVLGDNSMGGLVNKFTQGEHGEDWLNCTCSVCGKKFHDKPSHAKKCKNHYCSKKCFYEAKKEYMKGEGNHQYGLKGVKNASWKNDRRITTFGYIQVRVLDHPFRDKRDFVLEHRLVAEKYLLTPENSIAVNGKRYLKKEYEIHHKNFNRLDNRVENLLVLTHKEHISLHNKLNPGIRDSQTGRLVSEKKIAKRISETAIFPKRIESDIPVYVLYSNNTEKIIIPPDGVGIIPTGEAFDLRNRNVGAIFLLHGVDYDKVFDPHNCIKLIDRLDKGEILLPIENKTDKEMIITPHEKIAIMTIQESAIFELELVDSI